MRLVRGRAFRIAKEEREKGAQRQKRKREHPSDVQSRDDRDQPGSADEREPGPIETLHRGNPKQARTRHARASDALPVRVFLTMASHDVFHAIFELELFLFEGDFFNLFGF